MKSPMLAADHQAAVRRVLALGRAGDPAALPELIGMLARLWQAAGGQVAAVRVRGVNRDRRRDRRKLKEAVARPSLARAGKACSRNDTEAEMAD